MSTEARFLLAIGLMFAVIWGTNQLFPPVLPDEVTADSLAAEGDSAAAGSVSGGAPSAAPGPRGDAEVGVSETEAPVAAEDAGDASATTVAQPSEGAVPTPEARPRRPRIEVPVRGPRWEMRFDSYGARLLQAELLSYRSLVEGNGNVRLVPDGSVALHKRLVVGGDTVDLAELDFAVDPAGGLELQEGDGPADLTFSWESADGSRGVRFVYTFTPDRYLVQARSEVRGFTRPLLVTGLGRGIAFSEADSAQEVATMAWVGNHLNEGIDATAFTKVDEARVHEGPFSWAGIKNKYFLMAVISGTGEEAEGQERYLGGVLVEPTESEVQPRVAVTSAYDGQGETRYRLFLGPQEYSRLQSIGADLEEVNPYGWKFLRPIIRPFVVLTLWVLNFLHDQLSVGYGWVLVIFGVLMRILLWPLNQKAMRAQINNMAVQPLVKEIQTKYKDNPEKMQKEMLRLYKEYGFNPLGGCLPLLLPWPVLIALFFVFQNTIELRGVPFLWLPDLSAKDPFFILPIFLAVSMFALQFISFRSMGDQSNNPQMKMMMYFMPLFFGFIFMNFPSGLNLYYATTNVATIPQQVLIARERMAAQKRGPVRRDTKKKK
jgi:YidC/Oxa1 family membrane protein insertase